MVRKEVRRTSRECLCGCGRHFFPFALPLAREFFVSPLFTPLERFSPPKLTRPGSTINHWNDRRCFVSVLSGRGDSLPTHAAHAPIISHPQRLLVEPPRRRGGGNVAVSKRWSRRRWAPQQWQYGHYFTSALNFDVDLAAIFGSCAASKGCERGAVLPAPCAATATDGSAILLGYEF